MGRFFILWESIEERVRKHALYIVETGATVRACAKKFGASKSTVHKDVTERLFLIDKALFGRIRKVLELNLSERHIRGGIATKRKFERKKEKLQNRE